MHAFEETGLRSYVVELRLSFVEGQQSVLDRARSANREQLFHGGCFGIEPFGAPVFELGCFVASRTIPRMKNLFRQGTSS
jgi:hypothetical protein